MTIHLPDPPPQAADAVADRLRRVGESHPGGRASLGGSDPNGLEPIDPHQVFALGLQDILDSSDALAAAQPVGWRFLLADRGGPTAAAQTVVTPDGDHRFASFNSGPYVGATVTALESVRDHPEASEADLEVRLLTVPAVNLTAIWLHGDDRDVLVPMDPAPPGVDGGRRYPSEELLAALREPARALVEIRAEDATGS